MKGQQHIIDLLNGQLTLELTSMDQYLAHAKMYEDWGMLKESESFWGGGDGMHIEFVWGEAIGVLKFSGNQLNGETND